MTDTGQVPAHPRFELVSQWFRQGLPASADLLGHRSRWSGDQFLHVADTHAEPPRE